ncbi:MAG: lipopolysaccharide biosynthesis protein [Alphaproteobacteria bacterium]
MSDNVSKSSKVLVEDADQARGEIGKGSVWMITMRWMVRLIGVVSTIILARLLTPEDFGIVAIAMLIVNFVEVFANTGLHVAIIRHKEDTRDLYDSAWTVSIIFGAGLTAIILALSPLTIAFFDEPRSFLVIIALAFRPLIIGFENVGLIAFRKELNFRQDFRFGVIRKLSFFVPTIAAAFISQNHWALVIGALLGGVATVGASYWAHPFRPRIGFSHARELLVFSAHLLSQSLTKFITGRLDEFIVGGFAGTAKMGLYHVAADVGTAPTEELVRPISRSLHPVYAKLKDDGGALRTTYLSTLSMVATLAFSAGTGVAFVARELVDTLLGDRWHAASGIVVWISLTAVAVSIIDSAPHLMNPIGKERQATWLAWIYALMLAPVVISAGMYGSIEDIAAARFAISVAMVPISLTFIGWELGIGPAGFANALWRPALGAMVMVAVLSWLDGWLEVPVALDLLISVLLGGATFVLVVTIAWLSVGRPVAFETTAIELAKTISSRLTLRWR